MSLSSHAGKDTFIINGKTVLKRGGTSNIYDITGGSSGGSGGGGGALGSFSQYVDSAGYVDLTGTSATNWATAHTIPSYDSNSLYAYTLINTAFAMYINARNDQGRFMNATIAEVQGFRYGVDMNAGGSHGWPVALVTTGEYADSNSNASSMAFTAGTLAGTPMDYMSIGWTEPISSEPWPGGSMMYRNSSSVGYGLYTRIDPSNGAIQIRSHVSQGDGVTGGFMWFKLNTTTVPCFKWSVSDLAWSVENYTHT